jgi:hypothetical protein
MAFALDHLTGSSRATAKLQNSLAPKGMPAQSSAGLVRVQGTDRTFAKLITRAESEGPVRVIVGLNTPFLPEGFLANAQLVQSQRRRIAQAQNSLIGQLMGSNARSITRFTFIPFMAIELDAPGLKFLQNSPEVSSIEEDLPRPMALAESVPLIGGTAAWASGFSGAGQAVAILDSGVDKTHSFMSGKVVSEACYSSTNASFTSTCPGGVTESTSTGSGVNCPMSLNGDCAHGTHVAGIAAGKGTSFSGVARDANIIAIQVFSQPVSGGRLGAFDSDMVRGLQRVHELSGSFNIAAANMSIGGGNFTTNCDSVSPSLKAAIDTLRSVDIPTIIAAGNNGSDGGLGFPACISTAISAGSTDDGSFGTIENEVSSFSNSASFLHLLAPGRWINSSVPGEGFSNFIGTSMAAPHIAGAWAVLRSKAPSATLDQVLQALTSTGLPVTDSRNGITKPRIKVDAALNALASSPTRILTVASSNPNSNVSITLSPNDNNGFGDGTTQFSRTYNDNANVSLGAPATAGGNNFQKWQRNGVDWSFSQSTNVTMDADYTMTAVYVSGVPPGPVAEWKFDENTGTTAADSSGNGNTGTLTSGAGWATGQSGSAVNLDGVNDHVQVGAQSSLVMSNTASITAWLHPTGPGSDPTFGAAIVAKEGEYVLARLPNGRIHWAFANSNPGWQLTDTGFVAPLNQWTHIAVTYDQGTIRTYANGSLVHTHNGAGAIGDVNTGQNDLRIGGRQMQFITHYFQGRIDEVRLYNRAITESEITELVGDTDSGLKGYWQFDENTGTTAADSSGNGNTGTLASGAGWATGQNGSAVNLDGVNDHVQVGTQSSLVMSNTASITAWLHPTGPGSDPTFGAAIVAKEGEYVLARLPNGRIHWAFANSSPGWQLTDTGFVAPLNQWTHIAVTYDQGTIKTYANGNLVHTHNGAGAIGDVNTGQNDLRIGGRQMQFITHYFQGRIDEVRLYNRAISESEITELVGDPDSGLKGYWQFDENTGTTAADSSGNGNTGTLTSGAGWATGQSGSAVNLDGVNDHVQVGAQSSLVMGNTASITAWLHPTGPGSDPTFGAAIVAKEGEYVLARLPNGRIHWAFANSNPGWQLTDTGFVAPLNQWTHIVVTYDQGTIKTYANGNLVHTHNGAGAIGDVNTGQNDLRIGGRQMQFITHYFQGRIDEVRVYNRAISESEITDLLGGG